tara:strand:+ start:490 stop:1284 length:795 start_codon:yes stop_codon:yes gene_type:complete
MSSTINFDPSKFIDKLNILERSVSKTAISGALKSLGYVLTKEEIPKAISGKRGKYGGYRNPVSFTKRAFFYSVRENELAIKINENAPKGNAPARYLYPVTQNPGSSERKGMSRSKAMPTRFAGHLKKKGFISGDTYPSPNFKSTAFKKTPEKNIRSNDYRQVLFGLARTISPTVDKTKSYNAGFARQAIFSIGTDSGDVRGGKRLTPGIYRAKAKNSLEMLFRYLPSPPSVPIVFEYQDFVASKVEKIFSERLKESIKRQIDRA